MHKNLISISPIERIRSPYYLVPSEDDGYVSAVYSIDTPPYCLIRPPPHEKEREVVLQPEQSCRDLPRENVFVPTCNKRQAIEEEYLPLCKTFVYDMLMYRSSW
jgi:hypothetical protein